MWLDWGLKMSIDNILEEATPKQTEEAIRNSPFEILARQGHMLFFGVRIGARRNQFWYSPLIDKFVIDFMHLDDNVANLIPPSYKKEPVSMDKKQEREKLIMASLGQLNGYLAENLAMFNEGKIDMQGSVLGIPNRDLYDYINELRKRTFALNSIPVGTPEFVQRVEELAIFYKQATSNNYKITQTPHPPSL